MKVIKAFGPHDLKVVDIPTPTPNSNEVLVAMKACGICGSDKWYWEVNEPTDFIAGHEVAGEVVSIGSNVENLKVGDAVAINNVKGCGVCDACEQGNYVACQEAIIHMSHGFSEYVAVPERNCLILDKRISYEEGALIFDNWGTPFGALDKAKIKKGELVVICGLGPIGVAAVSLAKLKEVTVLAIDPIPYRRDFAKSCGADYVMDPLSKDILPFIKEFTKGKGADTFIECSGNVNAYTLAFESLRKGGKLVTLGEGVKLPLDVSRYMIGKQLHLIGSLYSTMEQGEYVQQLILEGAINPLKLVTHRFDFEELPKVFGDIFSNKEGILKTLLVTRK